MLIDERAAQQPPGIRFPINKYQEPNTGGTGPRSSQPGVEPTLPSLIRTIRSERGRTEGSERVVELSGGSWLLVPSQQGCGFDSRPLIA